MLWQLLWKGGATLDYMDICFNFVDVCFGSSIVGPRLCNIQEIASIISFRCTFPKGIGEAAIDVVMD